MERFGSTILFGKYELCRLLGRGRSGTVYLVKHKELEEYRARSPAVRYGRGGAGGHGRRGV